MSRKKKLVIEWGLIIGTLLFFNLTSYGTEVQGFLQRGLLWTGMFNPDVSFAEEKRIPANYDVNLVSLDGEPTSLADFKGKTIFMNMWATWCPPCLAEMPFIQNLYDEMGNESVAFVMISVDDTDDVVREFIRSKGYSLPVYRLAGPMPDPYTSNALPTTYVISPDGMLATVHAGMANYDSDEFKSFLRSLEGTASATQ
jgi:thiol-disulfide isomerase/thioredoxin